MKKLLIWAFIAIFTLTLDAFTASAKGSHSGMKLEIVETDDNDSQFSIFTYQEEKGGPVTYYLGIGREFEASEVFGFEIFGGSLSHIDESAVYLGATADEALASLDALFNLFDKDVDFETEFPGRLSNDAGQLGNPTKVACVVKKKFLSGKFLRFYFVSGKHNAEADLGKSSLKFLRKGLEMDMKRHKN